MYASSVLTVRYNYVGIHIIISNAKAIYKSLKLSLVNDTTLCNTSRFCIVSMYLVRNAHIPLSHENSNLYPTLTANMS